MRKTLRASGRGVGIKQYSILEFLKYDVLRDVTVWRVLGQVRARGTPACERCVLVEVCGQPVMHSQTFLLRILLPIKRVQTVYCHIV